MSEHPHIFFYACPEEGRLRDLLGEGWAMDRVTSVSALDGVKKDHPQGIVVSGEKAGAAFLRWCKENEDMAVLAVVDRAPPPEHAADWVRLPVPAEDLRLRLLACARRWKERCDLLFDTSRLRREHRLLEQMTDSLIKKSIELRKAKEEVEKLSLTDALTKLHNRRFFDMQLERDVMQSRRYQTPLSLFILDIDDFKKVNDTYGHQAGDEVLVQFSRLIKKSLRETDWAARYGGEEFCVVLPMTASSGAITSACRLRKSVEQGLVRGDGRIITASVGVCSFNPDSMSLAELVGFADQALYHCKKTGKNKVTYYDQKKGDYDEFTG